MRDYSTQANKFRQNTPKYSNGRKGAIFFIIVIVGIVFGLIWFNQPQKSEISDLSKPSTQARNEAPATVKIESGKSIAENIPVATENFYTFYDLLLQNEVPIDKIAGQTRDQIIAKKLKTTLVQVASFRSADAAESMRIKLLFLDLKARIIPASETNGGWYRIVLGPFKTVRDMNSAMDLLAKNGHQPQRVTE